MPIEEQGLPRLQLPNGKVCCQIHAKECDQLAERALEGGTRTSVKREAGKKRYEL